MIRQKIGRYVSILNKLNLLSLFSKSNKIFCLSLLYLLVFQCDLCLKTCDRESDLVQHFSHCTGKPNYYPCNKCDMVCDSRASLRYHRRQHVVCVQYACRLIYLLKSKNFIFELISSHFSLLNRTKLQNRDEVLIVQKHIEGKNFDLRKFSFVYMMTYMTIILLLLQFQFFDLGT